MKATISLDVYCPAGCGAVMNKTEDGRLKCTSPNCKLFGVLFLQPTIDLLPDRKANLSPAKPEVKT